MLLTSKNVLKLTDLGTAKDNSLAETFAGTPVYMSPEQFRCFSETVSYTSKADIW